MASAMAIASPLSLSVGFGPRVRANVRCRCRHAFREMLPGSGARTFFLSLPLSSARRAIQHRSASQAEERPAAAAAEDKSPFSVLASMTTLHNDIMVVDTPTSRLLILDSSHNIHSMLDKERLWTGSYWDEFTSLPPIIPEGPIAILGLGGGTAAQIMLKSWPNLQLEGWEIDEIVRRISQSYNMLSYAG